MATENPVSKLIVKENKIETKWNHHAKCKRNWLVEEIWASWKEKKNTESIGV